MAAQHQLRSTLPRERTVVLLAPLAAGAVLLVSVALAVSADVMMLDEDLRATAHERSAMAGRWAKRRPEGFPATWTGDTVNVQIRPGFSLRYVSEQAPDAHFGLVWVEAGWPLPALDGAYWRRVDLAPDPALDDAPMIVGRAEHSDGAARFVPADLPLLGLSSPRFVPTRPAWGGLLVDTVIVLVLFWLLAWGIALERAARRRRRGLCAVCAYPVGDAGRCSECGAVV